MKRIIIFDNFAIFEVFSCESDAEGRRLAKKKFFLGIFVKIHKILVIFQKKVLFSL